MNIEDVFAEASSMDGEARKKFLDEHCKTPDDRRRLEQLLAAHDQAGEFLQSPVSPVNLGISSDSDDTAQKQLDGTLPALYEYLGPGQAADCPSSLDHYEILGLIGQGGMGIVLKGRDKKLKRDVALKILPWSLMSEDKPQQLFLREAQATAKVAHPNIVTIHAVEDGDVPYIVMEFVPGESLQDRLKRLGTLPPEEVVRLGRQIASGLSAAHQHRLVHRDIKPSNLLLDPEGQLKIVDFGLVKVLSEDESQRLDDVAGTPQFMSPEQASGQPVDHRTDLFSLGTVLYTLCTGQPPFRGDSVLGTLEQVKELVPKSINDQYERVPPALDSAILRLMSKDPNDRFQNAGDVIRALDAVPSKSQEPPSISKPPTTQMSHRRTWTAAAIGLATCLLLLVTTDLLGWTQLSPTLADVLQIRTATGTLQITIDDPSTKVTVDGDEVRIKYGASNELTYSIGKHLVEATRDGVVVSRRTVEVTRDGNHLFSIEEIPSDADAESAVVPSEFRPIVSEPLTLGKFAQDTLDVCFHPKRNLLAFTQFGGKLTVVDLDQQPPQQLFEARVKRQIPDPLHFSADGERLTCGAKQWETINWSPLADHLYPVLAWSPQDEKFACRIGKTKLGLFESGETTPYCEFETNQSQIFDVEFSPDAQLVATAGVGQAKLWESKTGERLAEFHVTSKKVLSVLFDGSGEHVVTTSSDQTAKLWSVDALRKMPATEPLMTFEGHGDSVAESAFLAKGRVLVTVSNDHRVTYPKPGQSPAATIKFWDVATGEELWNQPGHGHNVTSLAVRADESSFATTSYDESVRVWTLRNPITLGH